ncbi:tRNA pseudouridine(54/55) synthase Pus10 [Candidatus Thorarchaeota archaeon]|nr:MAG: tRNA pseudouridine(54/55) synthase Pus10 [Candidatus Thorarchaeota archaeon]
MPSDHEYVLLEKTISILEDHILCDRCLGRLFAWLSTATTNTKRGGSLKLVLSMMAGREVKTGRREVGTRLIRCLAENGLSEEARALAVKESIDFDPSGECEICSIDGTSIFDRMPAIAARALEAANDVEYDTLLVGSVPINRMAEREEEIRGKFNLLYGEPLKSEFNRALGKEILDITGKTTDFEHPDIVFVYNMEKDEISLQINPIFIYGRYRKLQRGIPQSRWDCSECGGKGCESCNGTGRRYPDSISEYVGDPLQEMVKGTRYKFHAAGREDVDALMVGAGRPFVLEVSEPRVRRPDLAEATQKINERSKGKIEVQGLEMTERERAQTLKAESSENIKEYRAIITIDEEVPEKALKRAESALSETTIHQRTPNRVSHRRSDRIREKRIYEVRLSKIDKETLEGHFRVQGGTYIKELISGDEGRTKPSIGEILGVNAVCKELNVTAIHSLDAHHNA